MKSATSLLNRTLLGHFTGSVFWLAVLFLIGNILIQPLPLWIASVNMQTGRQFLTENPLNQMAGFQLAGGMVYIVFLAVFLFSYKNKEDSLDFMHALPVRRKSLLSHALMAGFVHIVMPLAITAVILFFERYFLAFDIAVMHIVEWFFYSLFVLLVVFAFSVFAGFLVNSGFVHMQLVIIIFFLPVVFWWLNVMVADMLYEGVNSSLSTGGDNPSSIVVDNTFPIFAVQQIAGGMIVWKILMWSILAAVLTGLSYLLYARNQNENVHASFNQGWFRNMLVALLSISGMLLTGLVISSTLPEGLIIFILSFLTGGVFSYIVVEMSFQGTVRIQRRRGSLITSGISIVVFWAVFAIGWQQYASYVPDASKVEGVGIDSSWNMSYQSYGNADRYMSESYLHINDPEVIEETVGLHREMVDAQPVESSMNNPGWVEISYSMADGSTVSRQYDNVNPDDPAYRDILSKVNGGEYARNYDVLYNVETPSAVKNVDLNWAGGSISIEDGAAFVEEYKRAAHRINEEIPLFISNGRHSIVDANIDFDSGSYSGNASIYNPVLQEAVQEEQSLTRFLNIGQSEDMFVISLDDEEKQEFFKDYRTLQAETFITKYDLDAVTGEERSRITDTLDQGGLDPSGDRVVLFQIQTGSGNGMITVSDEYALIGIE